MALSLAGALGIGLGASIGGGIINNLLAGSAVDKQIQGNKELFNYQWNKAYSPQAQVKNLTAAGLNPAAQFGNGSAVLNSAPSVGGVSQPQVYPIDGTQSLTDLAQYIAAGAQEKKTGADIGNVEADTELKKIQADRERFQNDLLNRFGLAKGAADLALAQEQVRLAKLNGDDKKRDIAIKHWTEAKEKAMSECNEAQRDILQKELANKDIELDIRNRAGEASIGEIKSRSAANYASADASRASAAKTRSETDYQRMVNRLKSGSLDEEFSAILSEYAEKSQENAAKVQEFKDMYNRYKTLNDNNEESAAADYINHLFWFVKERMPSLPIVPFLKLGK